MPSFKVVANYIKSISSRYSVELLEDIKLQRRGLSKSRGERLYPSTPGGTAGIDPDHISRYEWARHFCSGKRVIDYGCGVGYGAYLLSDVAASVVGYDVSKEALVWARYYAEERPNLSFTDVLPIESFECITCFECIEHVPDPQSTLDWLSEHTSGDVFISTPEARKGGWGGFHIKEFEEEEFLSMLRERFETVVMTEQMTFGCRVMLARCSHPQKENRRRV